MTRPRPIPEGYGTVTPWVVTRDTRAPAGVRQAGLRRRGAGQGRGGGRGDRVGRVRDPLGNIWWTQERVEEPSPEEVARRFQDPKFTEAMRYVQSTLAASLDAS